MFTESPFPPYRYRGVLTIFWLGVRAFVGCRFGRRLPLCTIKVTSDIYQSLLMAAIYFDKQSVTAA
jgi:hypothetical protein